jgi:hypothetical protein
LNLLFTARKRDSKKLVQMLISDFMYTGEWKHPIRHPAKWQSPPPRRQPHRAAKIRGSAPVLPQEGDYVRA